MQRVTDNITTALGTGPNHIASDNAFPLFSDMSLYMLYFFTLKL